MKYKHLKLNIKERTDSHEKLGFSEVLLSLVAEKKLTEAELARQVNISQSTIHRLLTGEMPDPKASTLKSLAHYFEISIDQLLGEQPLTKKNSPTVSIPVISWQVISKQYQHSEKLTPNNWKEWVTIEGASNRYYALLSKASMEPRFPQKTILVIDPILQPTDGDLVVISKKSIEEATLREYFDDGLVKYLKPITPDLPTEVIDESILCLGVLVKSIFNFHDGKK